MEEEEGKLKDQEDKPKEREGKRRLREEEGKQMAEEDKLKLVGKLIVAESIVLVGTEMVQSMVLSSEVLEAHNVVLIAQNHNFVSAFKERSVCFSRLFFVNKRSNL